MAEMKAMEFTDELKLQPVRRAVPEPQAGEILIQVSAAGVTHTEKLWRDLSTVLHARSDRQLNEAVPPLPHR